MTNTGILKCWNWPTKEESEDGNPGGGRNSFKKNIARNFQKDIWNEENKQRDAGITGVIHVQFLQHAFNQGVADIDPVQEGAKIYKK